MIILYADVETYKNNIDNYLHGPYFFAYDIKMNLKAYLCEKSFSIIYNEVLYI